jgi:hypothetical protein
VAERRVIASVACGDHVGGLVEPVAARAAVQIERRRFRAGRLRARGSGRGQARPGSDAGGERRAGAADPVRAQLLDGLARGVVETARRLGFRQLTRSRPWRRRSRRE